MYNFERALQASDPGHSTLSTKSVAIPFWDWTAEPQTGVRYPEAFEDRHSVLFHGERNSEPSGRFDSPDDVSRVINTKSSWGLFAGGPKDTDPYSGALEQAFHEYMHIGFLGPPMEDPGRAAEDPIYWSFHAYIDRLWERWRRVHNQLPTSLDAVLRGVPIRTDGGVGRGHRPLGLLILVSG